MDGRQSFASGAHHIHGVTGTSQPAIEEIRNPLFVFDDKNAHLPVNVTVWTAAHTGWANNSHNASDK